MKIAFLLPNLQAGGGNCSQIMLANGLFDRGHDISIIVPRSSVSSIPISVKPKVIEKGIKLRNRYLSTLINYPLVTLGLYSYDAVIVTFSILALYVYFPSILYRLKVFNYARHYDPLLLDETNIKSKLLLSIYKHISRLSYKLPFFLIVNSKWTGQTIFEHTGKNIQYDVISNGVDLSIFKPNGSVNRKDNPRKKIMAIGKNQKWKGLNDLIDALCELHNTFENFELLIMSPDKLDMKDSLPFEVRTIHPEDDAAIAETYRKADVFVSSSWYEGFANPPLEAMACGIPVVLTDSGGVREYAVHGYNCLMSAPRQPEALAENIKLVLQDRKLVLRLTQNGLETVKAFTWGKSVDKFEKILLQKLRKA